MQRYLNLNNAYMNTLVDDDLSKKRFEYVKNVHSEYELPKIQVNSALHYKNDYKQIQNKYPTIDRNAPHFKLRPGAYGLTASLIKFLEKNKDTKDDFVIWYEDDALPGDNQVMFNKQLDIAMNLIKNNKNNNNNVYFLGYATHCRTQCKKINKWIEKNKKTKDGTHCIIFTKSSINTILSYMKNNIITQPIDNFLFSLHENKIINAYDWGNNVLNENPMYCGLFKQKNTYCGKFNEESIISNSQKNDNIN